MFVSSQGVWVTEEYLNNLVDHWFRRAVGENIQFDDFDRFVSLWIAFNAWGNYVLSKDNDRQMIEAAKIDTRLNTWFQNLMRSDPSFMTEVKMLKDQCPVTRSKRYRGSYEATIANVNNFPEVLEVIYAIRCNLFHGEKQFDSPRNRQLVSHALVILSKLFANAKSTTGSV